MQSFDTLTYREQLLHLQHLVEAALPHYGLQDARSVLLQYEDNAVYQITGRTGERFVLRISAADGHSLSAQRSEMQWLTALRRETNLCIPEPIANDAGDFVTIGSVKEVPEPRSCVLLHWVPGEPPSSAIDLDVVKRIGIFTAQLHQHAEQFVPPPSFVRPSWDWQQLFGASSVLGHEDIISALPSHYQEILIAVSRQVQKTLHLLGKDASQWGLIHADLHRDNILIHQRNVGVIDFDDCGWGYYMLDIASVLDSFFRRVVKQPEDYPPLRDAYLRGYAYIRMLPPNVDVQLRTTKVMRDMITVNFILSSNNASVHSWGQQRLAQIMAQLEAYVQGATGIKIQRLSACTM